MSGADARRWNKRYSETVQGEPQACYALTRYRHLLPTPYFYTESNTGQSTQQKVRALDLACGHGGNSVLLANAGFETHAWDISSVAINKLKHFSDRHKLNIEAAIRDVVANPPQPASFDVIVVSRFLDRSIVPAITRALRPAGVLYYQTFSLHTRSGPSNPDYLLQDSELLELFSSLLVRAFEDAAECGDLESGFRDESLIVAQRRSSTLQRGA